MESRAPLSTEVAARSRSPSPAAARSRASSRASDVSTSQRRTLSSRTPRPVARQKITDQVKRAPPSRSRSRDASPMSADDGDVQDEHRRSVSPSTVSFE